MDILLSIPVASYLLSPSSSMSTSVNLVFFYFTWSSLVLSHYPLTIHLEGVLVIRVLFSLLPGLILLLFDTALPSLAAEIKHGGPSALPPRNPRVLGWMVGMALLNVLVITGVEGGLSYAYEWVIGYTAFKTVTTLPLPWHMARDSAYLFLARELIGYYIHRHVLHGTSSSSTFAPIARLHTKYIHARRGAPFTLQIWTDHPVALIIHRLLPVYLPALIMRPHLLTYFLFVFLTTVQEAMVMSGYTIVPGIIMSGLVQRSAIHYASGGRANFGEWGALDWVHGTNEGRDVLEDVRAEADKHRVKQRSAKKADEGMNMLKDGMEALRSSGEESGSRRSTRKKSKKAS